MLISPVSPSFTFHCESNQILAFEKESRMLDFFTVPFLNIIYLVAIHLQWNQHFLIQLFFPFQILKKNFKFERSRKFHFHINQCFKLSQIHAKVLEYYASIRMDTLSVILALLFYTKHFGSNCIFFKDFEEKITKFQIYNRNIVKYFSYEIRMFLH